MPTDPPPQTAQAVTASLRFRVNRWFAVFAAAGLPVLVMLGFWQLARAAEKEQALIVFEAQSQAPPTPLAALDTRDPGLLDGRRVLLTGHYLPERAFLLDNRVLQGRVGYELLMPFIDASGITVIVNRGWLLAPPTRDQLPAVDTPSGLIALRGEIHVPFDAPPKELFATEGWPSVIQTIDVASMSARAELQVFPWLVRLEPGQPGVTEADWPRVNMSPDRHRAYAAQWFLMAIALAIVFVTGGTNIRAWLAARREISTS